MGTCVRRRAGTVGVVTARHVAVVDRPAVAVVGNQQPIVLAVVAVAVVRRTAAHHHVRDIDDHAHEVVVARAGAGASGAEERLTAAVDALVAGLLEERAQARADKDWARADAIRDRIKAAGVDVTDTPDGPTWSVN